MTQLIIIVIASVILSALVILWIYKEATFLTSVDEKFDKVMYEATMRQKYGKHL